MSSEDLLNEISAINSIYTPTTLNPSPTTTAQSSQTYTLTLPSTQISLQLTFPPTYPSSPPIINHLTSLGPNVKRGSGAAILSRARAVLTQVFQPGEVCLFDFLEELPSQLPSAAVREGAETEEEEQQQQQQKQQERQEEPPEKEGKRGEGQGRRDPSNPPSLPPDPRPQEKQHPQPTWHPSSPLTVKKSVFLAHATPVSSPAHAKACIAHLLSHNKHLARATHNISAWRIRAPSPSPTSALSSTASGAASAATAPAPAPATATPAITAVGSGEKRVFPERGLEFEECDDDGEDAAGGRLLRMLAEMEVWGVCVVVSRWYGGVKLGPGRFRCVCEVGREAVLGLRGG